MFVENLLDVMLARQGVFSVVEKGLLEEPGIEYLALLSQHYRQEAMTVCGFSPTLAELRRFTRSKPRDVVNIAALRCVKMAVMPEGFVQLRHAANNKDDISGLWVGVLLRDRYNCAYERVMNSHLGYPGFARFRPKKEEEVVIKVEEKQPDVKKPVLPTVSRDWLEKIAEDMDHGGGEMLSRALFGVPYGSGVAALEEFVRKVGQGWLHSATLVAHAVGDDGGGTAMPYLSMFRIGVRSMVGSLLGANPNVLKLVSFWVVGLVYDFSLTRGFSVVGADGYHVLRGKHFVIPLLHLLALVNKGGKGVVCGAGCGAAVVAAPEWCDYAAAMRMCEEVVVVEGSRSASMAGNVPLGVRGLWSVLIVRARSRLFTTIGVFGCDHAPTLVCFRDILSVQHDGFMFELYTGRDVNKHVADVWFDKACSLAISAYFASGGSCGLLRSRVTSITNDIAIGKDVGSAGQLCDFGVYASVRFSVDPGGLVVLTPVCEELQRHALQFGCVILFPGQVIALCRSDAVVAVTALGPGSHSFRAVCVPGFVDPCSGLEDDPGGVLSSVASLFEE